MYYILLIYVFDIYIYVFVPYVLYCSIHLCNKGAQKQQTCANLNSQVGLLIKQAGWLPWIPLRQHRTHPGSVDSTNGGNGFQNVLVIFWVDSLIVGYLAG